MIVTETLKIIKPCGNIRSFINKQIKEEELQAVLEARLYASKSGIRCGILQWFKKRNCRTY
jgi:hypothetical protein